MKFTLGLYTQLSHSAPGPVFRRALACILKPVLTYIHNNRDCRLSIAPGSALTNFLIANYPEINLLIASLAKAGSVELVSSSYNNASLSLIPHKDRAASVDKTTTLLRRTYSVRSTSLWCYGQIWSTSVVAMMKTIGLERVVVSGYDALSQKSSYKACWRMNELGRKIDVVQSNDRFSRLVSSYAQNEITLEELRTSLVDAVMHSDDSQDIVCMINLDQLCQGASYNREDDEILYTIFTDLYDAARKCGYTLSLVRDMAPVGVGYLPSGWYGRDSYAGSLSSFNELFIRNESFRFLVGRYLALGAFVDDNRKEKATRKRILDMLSSLPSGNLFLCDTHASCLSLEEHRTFYRTIIQAEASLADAGLVQTRCDVDDDGLEEEFCYGKQCGALFSLVGASVCEFTSKELEVNIFDAIQPWMKSFPEQGMKRSFTDSYTINGVDYDLSQCIYNLDNVNRARSEFFFSYEDEALPFSVNKHYRLANQNLYLSHTIVNRTGDFLKGEYVATVYFTLPGATAFAYDSRRLPLVGAALTGIKNVRINDSARDMQLSFTSTDDFSVEEDNRFQSEVTTLGSQQFYLYTRMKLHFSLNVAPQSAASLNIVTRLAATKEK